MKTFLLLSISLLIISCQQDQSLSDSFFRDMFIEFKIEDSRIVYLDSLPDNLNYELVSSFNRDTIKDSKNGNFIIFTESEKLLIADKLYSQNGQVRINNLVKGSQMLLSDSARNIFNDRSRGWPYFTKKYQSVLYSFSQPIFIRNDTLCVFYFGYACGELCGEGKFVVFKKTLAGWKPYVHIYGWMS